MGPAIAVLLLTDIFLISVGKLAKWFHRRNGDVIGVSGGLVLLLTCVLIAASMLRIAYNLMPVSAPIKGSLPLLALLFYWPVVSYYAWFFTKLVAHAGVESVLGLKGSSRLGSDFSRARAFASRNDIDGATAQYRRYFEDDPKDPSPLFAATTLLQHHRRHEDAAGILREVMQTFQKNDLVWTRAAYELATLFRMHLGEPETARYLYHQIIKRQPRSEFGRLAHGHLAGTWEESET